MSVAITEKIHKKLEEIGFGENEITTFQLINELKTRQFQFDIRQLINKIAFRNLSDGIAETFEKINGVRKIFLISSKLAEGKRRFETCD